MAQRIIESFGSQLLKVEAPIWRGQAESFAKSSFIPISVTKSKLVCLYFKTSKVTNVLIIKKNLDRLWAPCQRLGPELGVWIVTHPPFSSIMVLY